MAYCQAFISSPFVLTLPPIGHLQYPFLAKREGLVLVIDSAVLPLHEFLG